MQELTYSEIINMIGKENSEDTQIFNVFSPIFPKGKRNWCIVKCIGCHVEKEGHKSFFERIYLVWKNKNGEVHCQCLKESLDGKIFVKKVEEEENIIKIELDFTTYSVVVQENKIIKLSKNQLNID